MRLEFDVSNIKNFAAKMQEVIGGGLRKAAATALEELALKFLDRVVDEIVALGNFDTGRLMDSFGRGAADNVWRVGDSGLEIEVGSNVPYADWVNTGHWQRPGRFVPGHWAGDKFIYEPGAKTGMVLKASWVEGSHYFDTAYDGFAGEFEAEIGKKIEEWLRAVFA